MPPYIYGNSHPYWTTAVNTSSTTSSSASYVLPYELCPDWIKTWIDKQAKESPDEESFMEILTGK